MAENEEFGEGAPYATRDRCVGVGKSHRKWILPLWFRYKYGNYILARRISLMCVGMVCVSQQYHKTEYGPS